MDHPTRIVFTQGIPWGGIVAGALVALAAHLVLAIMGLGLGLGALGVASDAETETGTVTAAVGIWWSVSALLALFLGGWFAGRVAGGPFVSDGLFLAVLVWALVTAASFYLVTTTISTVLGGPLTVATDSVYGVLGEAETQAEIAFQEAQVELSPEEEEARREQAQQLVARAEDAMDAGLWAAFTLILGAGAAIAGVWFATEPPAWARPGMALSSPA